MSERQTLTAAERMARRQQKILGSAESRLEKILSGPNGDEKRCAPAIEGGEGYKLDYSQTPESQNFRGASAQPVNENCSSCIFTRCLNLQFLAILLAISGRLLGEVGYEFNLFFVWLLVSVVFVVVWKQNGAAPDFSTIAALFGFPPTYARNIQRFAGALQKIASSTTLLISTYVKMNKWLLWSNQLSRSERMIRFVSQKCSSSTFHNENPIVRKISRVLIANRGEISIRVMNTARKMGIECVAVYSDADKGALFVRKADKAFHIGPPTAAQSYLNMDKIIDTALKSGAEAIHPGYGFLSENANFAEKCAEAGIVFIGPPVQAIRDMGTKSLAKSIMDKAGVPIVQGYHGDNQTDAHLKSEAARIGYPVMLKAVYGGGGKGMRIAWKESEFDEQLASARNEAKKSFGNDDMLVEKFVERPRHVEVQVFGDHHNNYVHLWERDCSVQRRHQKIIEEAPAPLIDMDTRLRLGEAAKRAAAAVHYVGAGTVEFIMDPRGEFYFMEMNTRLQVEHPVSEAITGTDLVEWQLRVAQGEKLPLTQEQIPLNGHAFECRVYAENTEKGTFMPTAGKLNAVRFPKDARVETAVVSGDEVSVHYDPMIAKIIVWGQDRRSAARLLDKALADTFISGLPTNISFVRTVLAHEEFIKGNVYTDFIPDFQEELFAEKKPSAEEMIEGAVALYLLSRPKNINGPFQAFPMFRINYAPKKEFKLGSQTVVLAFGSDGKITSEIDGQKYEIEIHTVHTHGDELSFGITVNGKRWNVDALDVQDKAVVHGISQNEYVTAKTYSDAGLSGSGEDADHAVAPMPGIIEKILVQKGQQVTKGQPVAVMTAMKMEYIIRAPRDASIADIHVKPGKNVTKNTQIVTFEEEKAQANA